MQAEFQEVRGLLDLIDEARCALSESPDLAAQVPSFVVVGMQSVGKSSVLQRISHVGLPRDSNVCTRVPMELRIRCSSKKDTMVKVDGKKCDAADAKKVEAAIKASQDQILKHIHAEFSAKSVVVEVESRDLPNVTLIDLPGIFFASDAGDKRKVDSQKLVCDLIESKISRPNALILHVAPVNQDAATLNTWAIVRRADPEKLRTVCILTKADRVACKEDFIANLEHITKDDDKENRLFVLDGRPDEDEAKSLGKIRQWLRDSPHARKVNVGLPALQENLQKVLIKHTLACMPKLKSSLLAEEKACKKHLEEIGEDTPNPAFALVGGIRVFDDRLKKEWAEHEVFIRKQIESMSWDVFKPKFQMLESMEEDEEASALQFLKEKCNWGDLHVDLNSSANEHLRLALQARCLLERHRGIENVQFSSSSVILEATMSYFNQEVGPILKAFPASIFDSLEARVVHPALQALAGKFNGMLRRAKAEVLDPIAERVLYGFQMKAEEFCNDVLAWNEEWLFTTNDESLQGRTALLASEREWLDSLAAGATLELEPFLVKAAQARGFWQGSCYLLPDAVQKQVGLLTKRSLRALKAEFATSAESAMKLVKEPEGIAEQRRLLKERQKGLKMALHTLHTIEKRHCGLMGVQTQAVMHLHDGDGEVQHWQGAAPAQAHDISQGHKRQRRSSEEEQQHGSVKKAKTK